jgi:predicted nuclease of restriction endonuclease-like (RecB) superfamily
LFPVNRIIIAAATNEEFEYGWSQDVLVLQIESRLHEREGKALTNFQRELPPPESDMAE